jgi:hypothetical protein
MWIGEQVAEKIWLSHGGTRLRIDRARELIGKSEFDLSRGIISSIDHSDEASDIVAMRVPQASGDRDQMENRISVLAERSGVFPLLYLDEMVSWDLTDQARRDGRFLARAMQAEHDTGPEEIREEIKQEAMTQLSPAIHSLSGPVP